jgi:hypothetical protein
LEKVAVKTKTALETANERAAALKVAREKTAKKYADTRKNKPVGAPEVKKAAKEAGVSTEHRPLTLSEIKKVVEEWATIPASFAKVTLIGKVLKSLISGVITDKMAYTAMGKALGEKVSAKNLEAVKLLDPALWEAVVYLL